MCGWLTLDELRQRRVHGVRDVDIALRAHRYHVSLAELARSGAGFAEGGHHVTVEVELEQLAGETVDHEDRPPADAEAARQTRVLELADERAVSREDFDPLILAIRHPQLAFAIDVDAVRNLKLAGTRAFAAPRLEEATVLVELQHSRVAVRPRRVALRDEHVALRADRDVVRLVEL